MSTADPGPVERATAPVPEEGLPRLLAMLVHALLGRMRDRAPESVSRVGITVCGLVLMVTPLALWVAWSKTVLLTVLVICLVAVALLLVFVWLAPGDEV